MARVFLRGVATAMTFYFARAQSLVSVALVWGTIIAWLHYQFWWEGLPMAAWLGTYAMAFVALVWTGLRIVARRYTTLFEV